MRSLQCIGQISWDSEELGGSVLSEACTNSALSSSKCSQTSSPFFPVAFYNLSNSFLFKADHTSAYLTVGFFLLPLPFEGCFALLYLPPPLQLKES